MRISRAAAQAALQPLADASGLALTQIAWGVHNLVNESMASAARVHIAEHGSDPRRFALLTTGGGGPVHGCDVARKLGISTIVCPPSAGVASAIGLLVAPARIDRVATIAQPLDTLDWAYLEATFRGLEQDALRVIAETGIDPDTADVARLADIRYFGQGFELVVALPPGPYSPAAGQNVHERFETDYRAVFARTPPETIIEIINIRVSATAPAGNPDINIFAAAEATLGAARKGSRLVYFGVAGDFLATSVYDRKKLPAGAAITGPAVIEEAESTLLVPPDGRATVMPDGNILTRLGG
jgi:N-methylhydantoinase A